MKKIKNEKGITLVALAVAIVVMLILIISLTASMTSTIELKQYNKVKEDVIALTEEVKVYYVKNETLPIHTDKVFDLSGVPTNDKNPNDLGNYYPIDISVLSTDLSLNCGDGNKNKNFDTDDLYVINETSLTVYYLQGAILDGQRHYTIIDDFSGGSFASEYYSKVELPILSVITMESNGANKELATVEDTVTLKMLSNYTLTKEPTVTIFGNTVEVTWNGNIGTATYTFPALLTEDQAFDVGERIAITITDYEADGRVGETISNVNFGNGVVLYAKERLKVGDYVNYTYDTVSGGYSLTAAVSGYDTDQTISQPTETLKWRVLSINNDGSVDLVSETPTDQDVYFKGSLGYNNGVYTLNDMCAKLFSNTNLGITARSIALEDIESKMNSAGIAARNGCNNGNKTYGETQTYTSSSYRYYPNLYASQIGAGINTTEVTQPDITGINPYKESSSGYTAPTTETYSQAGENGLTVTQTYYNMSSPSNYFDDSSFYSMMFEAGVRFWLATRYSACWETYASFGLRSVNNMIFSGSVFRWGGDWETADASSREFMRPVVSIIGNQYKVDSTNLTQNGSTPELAYDIVLK